MTRGRKALEGTHEAREKIVLICNKISQIKELSEEAKERTIKALKFGLGIKEENIKEKINKAVSKVIKEEEKEIAIKEKKDKKSSLNNVEGDEYFPPEKCYEVTE